MKNYTLVLIGVIFSVIMCAALFFGYRAYRTSIRIENDFKQSQAKLEKELSELKAQLLILKNRAEDEPVRMSSGTGNPAALQRNEKTLAKDRKAISRLEKIVESTGLEQLAENRDMDPKILSELYLEYTDRKQVAQRHEMLLEKNGDFHKADADQYGEELMALYERARWRRGSETDRQDRDSAFAELLAKYPEAYATGMAIADRALFAGFRRNTSDVEKYYDMLRENQNFSHIVTDRGVEAIPNIEYYLARQYLRQGNNDEAAALIDSLELNYPDSLLFSRRSEGGRRWQTVTEIIGGLRRQAETAR